MNVLINLLPDIRQAKQREKTRRQLFTGVALLIWGVCAVIVVVLVLSTASQKLIINDLTTKIAAKTAQLQGTPNLLSALNTQQHLASLPGLYSQRTYFTRLLDAYSQLSPTDVQINSLSVSGSNQLVTVSGTAKSYQSVTKLVRSFEGYNVTVGKTKNATNQPYFTNVQITSISSGTGLIQFTVSATAAAAVTAPLPTPEVPHGNN